MANNIIIENAQIAFRNFSGKEGQYNPAGKRNFCVIIDSELGEKLKEDGWNVRWLEPRNDGDERKAYMQVTVSFANIPPKVVVITSRGKTALDEETIGMLDWAEVETVDLIINPYNWNVNGRQGVKAYVKSLYVTLVEDELERKYHDIVEDEVEPPGESLCGTCGKNCGSKGECRYEDAPF